MITIAELRAIMRKFKIPGAYDVNAANKAAYVDLVTREIEKQGITCATDKKTVVSIIKRLDTQCGSTKIPFEQTAKMYIIDDTDIAEIIRKIVVTCEKGYCDGKDVMIDRDGSIRVDDRSDEERLKVLQRKVDDKHAKELQEAGIKARPGKSS